MRGSTLSRFEAWWEAHGFKWLKDKLMIGQSPLAAHQATAYTKAIDSQPASPGHNRTENKTPASMSSFVNTDVFAEMLTELTNEVLDQSFDASHISPIVSYVNFELNPLIKER